jgi:hypothetical protein
MFFDGDTMLLNGAMCKEISIVLGVASSRVATFVVATYGIKKT